MNCLFCKPICKPDAARQPERRETEPTERDGICPICRGNRTRERRLETAKKHVVWLITQWRTDATGNVSIGSCGIPDGNSDGSSQHPDAAINNEVHSFEPDLGIR